MKNSGKHGMKVQLRVSNSLILKISKKIRGKWMIIEYNDFIIILDI